MDQVSKNFKKDWILCAGYASGYLSFRSDLERGEGRLISICRILLPGDHSKMLELGVRRYFAAAPPKPPPPDEGNILNLLWRVYYQKRYGT